MTYLSNDVLRLADNLDGNLIRELFAPKAGETEAEADSRCRDARAVTEWVQGVPCQS